VKFLVLGIGSIGRRHVGNLQSMGYKDIAAYDPDGDILRSRCREMDIEPVDEFNAKLKVVDAVIVGSPPSSHVDAALAAARLGKYVLVEKPLSNSLTEARRLLDYEDRIMVGHNVRYHPLVSYIKETLPALGKIFNVQMEYAYSLENARPDVDYRKGYYAKLGEGGVLLDHIHEIDYAQYLFGRFNGVYCVANKISDLEISSEDNANLILCCSEGFSLTLHIDYIQKRYVRTVKIIAQNGVLFGDYAEGRASLMTNDGTETNKMFTTSFDETYVNELADFVAMVNGDKKPAITVSSALHSLEVSQAARQSSESGRMVGI